jgi:transcription-repair coupling factor (superfamily II helicase)
VPNVDALLNAGDRPLLAMSEAAQRALCAPGLHHFTDARGSASAYFARALIERGAHVVVVTADADAARRARADLRTFLHPLPLPGLKEAVPGARDPWLLLAADHSPYAEVHPERRVLLERASALFAVARGDWQSAVLSAPSLLRRVPTPSRLRDAGSELGFGDDVDSRELAKRLTAAGYLRAPVVEDPATFAVRGGLIDVWPAGAERPLRFELFGAEIASIKAFDPEDQRTRGEECERAVLPPARESILDEAAAARARVILRSLCDAVNLPSAKARALIDDVTEGRLFFGAEAFLPAFGELLPLFDCLPGDTVFIVDDPPRVLSALQNELDRARSDAAALERPHFPVESLYLDLPELGAALEKRNVACLHATAVAGSAESFLAGLEYAPIDAPSLGLGDHENLTRAGKQARREHGKKGALDPLLEHLAHWQQDGLRIAVTARAPASLERMRRLLEHRGVALDDGAEPGAAEGVASVIAPLGRGLVAPLAGFVLVTEEEVFGQRVHRRAASGKTARALLEDLRALQPGDYVVHVEHGIGRYHGLERKSIAGVGVDLIVVEYAGNDKLFLPVYRLNQVHKYSGGEGSPRLDRLGGQSFAKTKSRVRQRVRQMADELLKLYAERASMKKRALAPPDDDYAAFEATFPFEETRDQSNAIHEVLRDLQSDRVMDRLVCGDVGFGKTEVAIRAAFLHATAGRQVALLCPTTVLAQQHLLTFAQRLADYALRVRGLSRFQSKADQQETLRGLKDGTVDLVIGTHRVLSKDVHFKRLGLLIVDEEQRFGVVHKERIKQLRASVDVLTLSATPIPRTLQMALGGLRDMSLIATPPVDRRAIRTITSRFDDRLITEAIEREIDRGGQVFYVYNRIEGLYERAQHLAELVPRARIVVGHGQLAEATLERTMLDFVRGKYDVLATTAIIESGLDIPRANTMIVDRADLFGLSQLYQLRGRVGRSNERAYCYLLVPPPSQLSEEARQRIDALERYTELGSGFHIASLDMELRGAGDLLGAEQSGFVSSVGFDLFCQMLEEATHELRGEPVAHDVDPELSFDVEALLPEEFIGEVGVRLSLYKRLASALDEAEVDQIVAEVADRFGAAPRPAERLFAAMRLKTELRRLRVLGCEASASAVGLHLSDDTPLDPSKVGKLLATDGGFRLSPDGKLTRRRRPDESAEDGLELLERTLLELAACWQDDAAQRQAV